MPLGDIVLASSPHKDQERAERTQQQDVKLDTTMGVCSSLFALEDVIDEPTPYNPNNYQHYLQWYFPRTRTRLLHFEDSPRQLSASTDALYPGHAGVALHMVVYKFLVFLVILK